MLLSRSLCIWWKGVYLQWPPKPVSFKSPWQQRIPGCFSFNLTVTLLQLPHSLQSRLCGWQEHTDCPNQDFCGCCSFQILFWQWYPICSAVAPGSHDKGKKRSSDKARRALASWPDTIGSLLRQYPCKYRFRCWSKSWSFLDIWPTLTEMKSSFPTWWLCACGGHICTANGLYQTPSY